MSKTIQDLETELTELENEFSKFTDDIMKRLDSNHEVDFIPTAMIWLGIHKYKVLQFIQNTQNMKAKLALDIDTAARGGSVKITESKISKLIDAHPEYQKVLMLKAKASGLIDAITSVSISLSVAVKIWTGTSVENI